MMDSDYYTWERVVHGEREATDKLVASLREELKVAHDQIAVLNEALENAKERMYAAEEAVEQAGYEYQNLLEST